MTTDGKISLAVLAGDRIGPVITEATVRSFKPLPLAALSMLP